MYPQHPNKPPLNLMDPFALQLPAELSVIPNVSIDLPAPTLDLSGLQFGLPELPPIDLNMPADFCEQYFDNVIDLSAKRAQAAFLNAQKVHAQVQLLRSLDKNRNVGTSSSSPGYIVEMPESPKEQESSSTVHQIEQGGQATAFHFSITEITDDSDAPQSINDCASLNTTNNNNVTQPVSLDNKSSSNASRIQILESIDSSSAQKKAKKDGVVAPPKPKPLAVPPTQAPGSPKEKVVVRTIGDIKKNDHAKTTSEATGKAQHPAQPQNISSKLKTNKDARVAAPTVKVSSSSDSGDKSRSFNDGAQLAPLDRKSASTTTPVQLLQSINSSSAQKEDKKNCVVAPPMPKPVATVRRPATQSKEPVKETVVVQTVRKIKKNEQTTATAPVSSNKADIIQHPAQPQNISSNEVGAKLNTTKEAPGVAPPVQISSLNNSDGNLLQSTKFSSNQEKAQKTRVDAPPVSKAVAPRSRPSTQSPEAPKEKIVVRTVREIKQNEQDVAIASASSGSAGDACHPASSKIKNSSHSGVKSYNTINARVVASLREKPSPSGSESANDATPVQRLPCVGAIPMTKAMAPLTSLPTESHEPPKQKVDVQTNCEVKQNGHAITLGSAPSYVDNVQHPTQINSNNRRANLNTTNNVAQPIPLDNKSSSNASRIQLLESIDSSSVQRDAKKDGVVASPKPKPVAAPPTPATGPPKEKVVVQTIGDHKKIGLATTLKPATSEATGKAQHPAQPQNISSKLNTNKDARVAAPTVKVSSSSYSGDKSKSFNNGAQLAPLDRKSANTTTPVQLLQSINSSSAQKEDRKNFVVAPPMPKPVATITRPATQSKEPLKETVVVQTVRKNKKNEQAKAAVPVASNKTDIIQHPAQPQNISSKEVGAKLNTTKEASGAAPPVQVSALSNSDGNLLQSTKNDSCDKSKSFDDGAQRSLLDSGSASDATPVERLSCVSTTSMTKAMAPLTSLPTQSQKPPKQEVNVQTICENKQNDHAAKLDSATSDINDNAQHLAHISSNNRRANLNTANNVAQPALLDNKSSSNASRIQLLKSIDSSSAQKEAKKDGVVAPPKPKPVAAPPTPATGPPKEKVVVQTIGDVKKNDHAKTKSEATGKAQHPAQPQNICSKLNTNKDARVAAPTVKVSSSSDSGEKSKSFDDEAQRSLLESESASDATPVERLPCAGATPMTKAMAPLTSLPTQSLEPPKQKVDVQTIYKNKQNDHAAKLDSATSDIIDNVQHPAYISSNNRRANLNTANNVAQPVPLENKSSRNASRIQILESIDSSSFQKNAKKVGVVAPPKPEPVASPTLPVTESPDPSKERIIAQIVHGIKEKDHATTFASSTSDTTGNVRHLARSQKISSSNDCSNMDIVAGSPMTKSMTSRTRPYTQSSETPEEKDFVQTVSKTKQNDDATTLASATSNTTDDAKHPAPPKKASSSIDCSIESPAPKVQETSIFDDHEQIDLAIAFAFATMDSSPQDTRSTNDVENSNFCSKDTKSCSNVSVRESSLVSVKSSEKDSLELLNSIEPDIPSDTSNTDVVTSAHASMKEEQKEKEQDASSPDGVVNNAAPGPSKAAERENVVASSKDSLSHCASVSSKPSGQVEARGKSKSFQKKSETGSNSDTRVTTDFFASGPAKNTRSRRASLVTQASNPQTVGSGRKRTIDDCASAPASAPSKPNRKKDAPVKSKTTKKSACSRASKSTRSNRNTNSGPVYPSDVCNSPSVPSTSVTKKAKLVNKKRDPRADVASNGSPVLLTSSERKRVIYVADDSNSNSTSATSKPFKKSDPRGKSKKASEKEPGPTSSKGTRLSGVRVEPRGSPQIPESVPSKNTGPSRDTSSNTFNRDAATSPKAFGPNYSVPPFKRPRMDYHLSSYSNLDLWNAILRNSAIPMPFGRVNENVPTSSTTQSGSSGKPEQKIPVFAESLAEWFKSIAKTKQDNKRAFNRDQAVNEWKSFFAMGEEKFPTVTEWLAELQNRETGTNQDNKPRRETSSNAWNLIFGMGEQRFPTLAEWLAEQKNRETGTNQDNKPQTDTSSNALKLILEMGEEKFPTFAEWLADQKNCETGPSSVPLNNPNMNIAFGSSIRPNCDQFNTYDRNFAIPLQFCFSEDHVKSSKVSTSNKKEEVTYGIVQFPASP